MATAGGRERGAIVASAIQAGERPWHRPSRDRLAGRAAVDVLKRFADVWSLYG